MDRHSSPPRSRQRQQRIIFATLTIALAGIFVWCLLLLARSAELRQDLERNLRWLDQMHSVRLELERTSDEGAVSTTVVRGKLQALLRASQDLSAASTDTSLEDTAIRLGQLTDQLMGDLPTAASVIDTEALWEASFAVLKAGSLVEEKVQRRIVALYERLNRHWSTLYFLVILCLLLSASNLVLLHLLGRRKAALEQAHLQAVEQASRDSLTGLWNREAIISLLRDELVRARRLESPLGVILTDLDDFRQVNGLLGQENGDLVLQEVSARLGSLVRPYDTMGRFGGDSFLIVLPNCDPVSTTNVAERLRQAVNDRKFEHGLGRIRISITLVHVSVERADETDADLMIHRLQERIQVVRQHGESGIAALLDSAVLRLPEGRRESARDRRPI